MRLDFVGGVVAVLVVAVVIVLRSALFTVYQTQQALVVRLGKPVRVVSEPGLHVKAPFIDKVIKIDRRILDLEAPPQEVIASDQKRLVVDAFARYRIKDPLQLLPDARLDQRRQFAALDPAQFGAAPRAGRGDLPHVVRDQRAELMARIPKLMDQEARSYGIAGGRRAHPSRRPAGAEQPGGLSAHADRAAARGGRIPRAGRAARPGNPFRADREVTVLGGGSASRKAEQIRGEGDAKRNQIFAEAFSKDPDFFTFYRSMQAYETGLKANDTRFLLKPDSSFFRFFNDAVRQAGHQSAAQAQQRRRLPATLRRLGAVGARARTRAGHVGFPGRARAGVRHRGTDFRGVSRCTPRRR